MRAAVLTAHGPLPHAGERPDPRPRRAGADDVVLLCADVDELAERFRQACGAAGDEARFSSAQPRSRTAAVLGYTNDAITPEQRRDALTAVTRHAATGRITVAAERVPLSDVGHAWRRTLVGDVGVRIVRTP